MKEILQISFIFLLFLKNHLTIGEMVGIINELLASSTERSLKTG